MPNIKLVLEYNGSTFHGWQRQPNARTIEEELLKTLRTVLREEIHAIYAAGRTDAGVHAKGQVVNFHVSSLPNLSRLKHSISSFHKGELSVISAEEVDPSFHSRKSALYKQYSYQILQRDCPAVLDQGQVWHIGAPLKIDFMREQAAQLVGRQDFTSLRGAGCGAQSPIREIFESELLFDSPYLTYRVVGDGFLKHMVRNIVGTLVWFGSGKLYNTSVQEILDAKDRQKAGITAPPYGLTLDWVKYAD